MKRIKIRRDSSANWTSNNPTLEAGEIGLIYSTGTFSSATLVGAIVGDGSSNAVTLMAASTSKMLAPLRSPAFHTQITTPVVDTASGVDLSLRCAGTEWLAVANATTKPTVKKELATIEHFRAANASGKGMSVGYDGGTPNTFTNAVEVVNGRSSARARAMRAYRSSALTLSSSGAVIVDTVDSAFNSANVMQDTSWLNTTTGRYTPQVEGLYLITGAVATTLASSNFAWIQACIFKNGNTTAAVTHRGGMSMGGASANWQPCSNVCGLVILNGTTDYVMLGYDGNNASGLACDVGSAKTYLEAVYLGYTAASPPA